MKVEQRRRLTELFSRGEEFTITDEATGQSETVWIRKLTPVAAETALAKAAAKRAGIFSMKKQHPPGEEMIAVKGQVDELDLRQLVIWATQGEMAMKRAVIETRVAYENDWTKDNYLDGLLEAAAEEGFEAREDEEADRIRLDLAKYQQQCDDEVVKELEAAKRRYEEYNLADLREHVLDELLKTNADIAWAVEYEKCIVWLSVFDNENRNERLFETRAEVDQLQTETIALLVGACDRINVGEREGKDSEPIPTS